jgi:transposase
MAFTWYGNQTNLEGRNFGPLALIVPLLERMDVVNIINRHLPADPQAEFDYGRTLSLLIAARLYSPVALSNVAEWAEEAGADILWDMPVEKMNDDRLGRALDAFFSQRHSILAHVALHVSRQFDIPLSEVHYDPTHILLKGLYEDSSPRDGVVDGENPKQPRSDDTLAPAHITKGRATDDAPHGARMIHAGLCTYVDELGPLPFFGHTVDGNQNGHTAVAEQLALIRKHLEPPELTMFSDRGTFSAGHLIRLGKYRALCSAPWGEFRELFHKHRQQLKFRRASYLSIEQQRRRQSESELPQEYYELAEMGHRLTDEDSGKSISCRLIFVFSSADQKVVRQQRAKQIKKLREGLEKIQQSVAAGNRSTDPQSVARRVNKLFGKKDAARYFTWEMQPLNAAERKKLPAPQRGKKRPTHRFLFSFDDKGVREDEQDDGYSVLVTTVPRKEGRADDLFSRFKQQNYSKHVNRQFKGPLAVRPVFLHSPQRVEALVFLLMIALTLYFLLQRMYRQQLPPKASQKQRRTTTATLMKTFANYTLLIHHTRLGREVQPTRLTRRQRTLLQELGFATPAQILSQRLPRPPT